MGANIIKNGVHTKRRILFYHTKGYYTPTIVGLLQKEDIQVSRRSVSDFLIRFKQTLSLHTFFPCSLRLSRKTARQVMASDWISTSLHGQAWGAI